jgi:predicted anti-sigma-YlaC factor YlaD
LCADSAAGELMTDPTTAGAQSECCPTREDLAAFLDGAVDSGERKRMITHLACCERCYEVFAGVARMLSEADGLIPVRLIEAQEVAIKATLGERDQDNQ